MDVLAVVRTDGAEITRDSLEVLAASQQLRGEGGRLTALLFADTPVLPERLFGYGVNRVAVLPLSGGAEPEPDAVVAAIAHAARELAAEVVLVPDDVRGREVAPRVAHRLHAGLVTEVVKAEADGKAVTFQRNLYGGRCLAVLAAERFPVVATIKPRAWEPAAEQPSGGSEVMRLEGEEEGAGSRTAVVEQVAEEVRGVRLESARVVVSGGRGLKGPEPFTQLEELATMLKGAVGATRAATDAGWVPVTRQVGQTGKTVSPDLYVAVGISGAIQHLAGMSASKTIVAINTDPDAPIFKAAHLGVVGDFKAVLPPFVAKVRELLGE
jgi:electron transfer flavoprotein alpha subunit